MPATLKTSLRAAGPLTALILIGAPGCTFHFGNLPCEARRTETAEYALDPPGTVSLRGFNGRIVVKGALRSGVRIERTLICRARTVADAAAGLSLIRAEEKTEKDSLSIHFENISLSDRQFQVEIVAEVPADAALILATLNGPVTVEGIRGSLRANTSNGRVAVQDCGPGDLHLVSSNGAIRAERITGSLEARTANGGIEVFSCARGVVAETSNGGVRVEASGGIQGDIVVHTSNGTIHCILPRSFSGEVETSTSNGQFHCDFPLQIAAGKVGGTNCRGTIGAGGHAVRLQTRNGSVSIQRSDSSGSDVPAEESPPPGGSRKI